MSQLAKVQELLRTLRLTETASHLPVLVKQAETNEMTYLRFLSIVLQYEQDCREKKARERRLKWQLSCITRHWTSFSWMNSHY